MHRVAALPGLAETALPRMRFYRARRPTNAIRIRRIATEFDAPVIDALFGGKLA